MMVLEIPMTNNIFNMTEHKENDVHLGENMHLFEILRYRNYESAAPMLMISFFQRRPDNESFILQDKHLS